MTRGQIAQLQDLSKCHFPMRDWGWSDWLLSSPPNYKLGKNEKRHLRRLTHQYRNQIRAIRKNHEKD